MKTYTELKKDHLEARKSRNVLVSNLLGTLVSEIDGQMKSSKNLELVDVMTIAAKKFIKGIEMGIVTEDSKKELEILNEYIPAKLSERLILCELATLDLDSYESIGQKMGIAQTHLKGKADGNDISRLVKQHYS
jgi:uncharacterized protein YqeY